MASILGNLNSDNVNSFIYDAESIDPDAQLILPLKLQPEWLTSIINLLVVTTFKCHEHKDEIIEELVKEGQFKLIYKQADDDELVLRPGFFVSKFHQAIKQNQSTFRILVRPEESFMLKYGFASKGSLPPLGKRNLFPCSNSQPNSSHSSCFKWFFPSGKSDSSAIISSTVISHLCSNASTNCADPCS